MEGNVEDQKSPEVLFAKVLENFQLGGAEIDPLEVIKNFTALASERAFDLAQTLDDSNQKDALAVQEFFSWDMETKLWHLVNMLYSFRLAEDERSTSVPDYSSFTLKFENYLKGNRKLMEIRLIIQWLQFNLLDPTAPATSLEDKWTHTKIAIKNKSLATLVGRQQQANVVDEIDSDAALRSLKQIAPSDQSIDSENFSYIYQLVLKGEIQAAVDFASKTGNYTLALILVASIQDYLDPIIDNTEDDMLDDVVQPSGIRHKYMWLQTMLKLAQSDNNESESLIYSFLSGGDQKANIENAGANWEICLLLYVNQLWNHHLRTYMASTLSSDDQRLNSVTFPTPRHLTVDSILNTLLKTSALLTESKNPFRVIMGSIMIDQLNSFLHNTFKSSDSFLLEDPHVLRVLAHLAVVSVILNLDHGSKTPTKIITKYISKLSEYGLDDLVPIYLAFIPDEKDVRECYSIFLTTIEDKEKRAKQIDMFKRLGVSNSTEAGTPNSSTTEDVGDEYDNKVQNILKRTVERVMMDTASHYEAEGEIFVKDDIADNVDVKLCKAVEWFYENRMYEDAITATRTVFRRFLLTGRLKAIKDFGHGKSFKSLLKNYDVELHTRSIGGTPPVSMVTEEDEQELIQYDKLVESLHLLDEWKTFSQGLSESSWKSKDVEKSISKTIKKVHDLIFFWFKDVINTSASDEARQIFVEYRSIYVPYFIIELLRLLQQSRLHDWAYIRQAFKLVNEVANDKDNDFLKCFLSSGRISEFVTLAGEVTVTAAERGKRGIYA